MQTIPLKVVNNVIESKTIFINVTPVNFVGQLGKINVLNVLPFDYWPFFVIFIIISELVSVLIVYKLF